MPLISNRYLAILGYSNSPARAHASLLKTLRLPAVISFSKTKQWTIVSQASTNRYFRTGEALSSHRTRVNLSKHRGYSILYWILNILFDLIILPLRPFYPALLMKPKRKRRQRVSPGCLRHARTSIAQRERERDKEREIERERIKEYWVIQSRTAQALSSQQ